MATLASDSDYLFAGRDYCGCAITRVLLPAEGLPRKTGDDHDHEHDADDLRKTFSDRTTTGTVKDHIRRLYSPR